jgi:hypothetical protein
MDSADVSTRAILRTLSELRRPQITRSEASYSRTSRHIRVIFNGSEKKIGIWDEFSTLFSNGPLMPLTRPLSNQIVLRHIFFHHKSRRPLSKGDHIT